ncbi:MAG: hypothetical protein ACOC7T_01495 [Planctomycetota bacterium]
MSIDKHDEKTLRCRRLGHRVTFRYCRTQEGASLCPSIMDCWWEVFEVQDFLREHLPAEVFAEIAHRPSRNRVGGLLAALQKARERTEGDDGAEQ